ncbi:hypothetical protein RND71_022014 [Anisodus tanguticus]|uniref:Hemerythrin-like domain-containing protein n=1 Tax=Anisodus tanguticus TaxID=243964 RepID=A0AAE1VGP4_9SOLA|nr:hypothetical protein RND71_022014 [Anisodus tanguticus]
MGNCLGLSRKSTSEIAPADVLRKHPAVKLYGHPNSIPSNYIRCALLYKSITVTFIPSNTHQSPVLHYKTDIVTGSVNDVLRYLDVKFPDPKLLTVCYDETTPFVVWLVILQHRSMTWHLERMGRWSEDLAARGGKARGDPAMGTPRMEMRKFARGYSQLLEVMLEHAQMEERVVFQILEKADRGLCKAANEEHARDLPMMNGIKEDIKSIGVLDSGHPAYQEFLCNLSTRLKTLKEHSKKHFEEEEKNLLPLMEAAELSKAQQDKVLDQCLDVMQGTHSHLFRFFMEGLLPSDAMHYLDMLSRCSDQNRVSSMLSLIVDKVV